MSPLVRADLGRHVVTHESMPVPAMISKSTNFRNKRALLTLHGKQHKSLTI